uniref:EB domain-containing protein n=1 Tax=Syphacia muris TaxID=451379 RepID=A0A0N5AUH0_9BILA
MRFDLICSLSILVLVLADFVKPQTDNAPAPKPEAQEVTKLQTNSESTTTTTSKQDTETNLNRKQQTISKENSSLYSISDDPFNPENDEEDYGDKAESVSTTNPDVIDDEAIQQLVNKFLNTGDGGDEGSEKVNKNASALINSSSYWNLETSPERSIKDPAVIKKWLDGYEVEALKVLHEVATTGWNYFTSISPLNKQMLDEAEEVEMLAQFVKSTSKQARQFDLSAIEDPKLKRQINLLTVEGINALNKTEYQQFTDLQSEINKAIADASICEQGKPKPCLLKYAYFIESLLFGLISVDLAPSLLYEKKPTKISYIWHEWREAIKKAHLIPKYEQLMRLTNKGAKITGFKDAGAMWRSPFDLANEFTKPKLKLMEEINAIYEQILPFYKQLHSYYRRQLANVYRSNLTTVSKDGPIPDHLFSKLIAFDSTKGYGLFIQHRQDKNLMDYDWTKNYYNTRPYKQNSKYAETMLNNFITRNVTSKKLFIQAYKFFKSLGYSKLPATFWQDSVFAKKWTREILCDPPTAYDMRDRTNYSYNVKYKFFRIKACAQVGEEGFKLAHKLFAQLYYQFSYRQQPLLFQEAANPSFLSAITGAFYIIAGNPEYLSHLNLAPTDGSEDEARQINSLYYEALTDFVKLPYDIVVDTWRFNIFEGKTKKTNWNEDWWKLREYYQGIKPPTIRNADDFDAITSAAIARVHSPAIRHFIGYVMQFQILKALCPQQTQLHKGCYLKESDVKNVKKVMSLGSSITWMEALEMITGSDKLDAKPLLEYYKLLITWLENTNEIDQTITGWDGSETPFTECVLKIVEQSELPPVTNSTGSERTILSADQFIKFIYKTSFNIGENCTNGQECLLDSVCRNGTCECNEGLYTLKIGNTYNCVPGNPADAVANYFKGFGDNKGGLVIGLYPKENFSTSSNVFMPVSSPKPTPQPPVKSSKRLSISILIIALSQFYLLILNQS